ncbi:YchJ family protein [Alteromonas sp. ASW11-36]|uniref:YchJ family protein n=1 Tax=Alteromonas arenosi TaxID=3055817 RepID=A0ABT7SXK9_9ALTE|nr:YchJ family protein [Alteromonas sp. ASW11-36]MDM7860937.1 YchJ family protein [Alteromonas sp. ASW11-36]
MNYPSSDPCPCGSGKPFKLCCLGVIENDSATTPEMLMRSRYSAYATANYQYILDTYTASTRPTVDADRLAEDNQYTRWLALRVLNATCEPNTGTVDFIAYFAENKQLQQLSEHSRFVKDNGRWRYIDGDINAHGVFKIGRNETCFCGSGNKFKRCCSPLITAG